VPPVMLHPPIFAGEAVSLFDIVTHMRGLERYDKEKQHT